MHCTHAPRLNQTPPPASLPLYHHPHTIPLTISIVGPCFPSSLSIHPPSPTSYYMDALFSPPTTPLALAFLSIHPPHNSSLPPPTNPLPSLYPPPNHHSYYMDALQYLQELQEDGAIRHLALTNFDTKHMAQIHDDGIRIVSNQVGRVGDRMMWEWNGGARARGWQRTPTTKPEME